MQIGEVFKILSYWYHGKIIDQSKIYTLRCGRLVAVRNPAMRYVSILNWRRRGQSMKKLFSIFLLAFSCNSIAGWVEYSTQANGDVFFFDDARIETNGDQINVWSRVRYKTSVMGAASYQSFLRLDCSKNSETELQSTFYSDGEWSKPAMATNTNAKPEKQIKPGSASLRLVNLLCKE